MNPYTYTYFDMYVLNRFFIRITEKKYFLKNELAAPW